MAGAHQRKVLKERACKKCHKIFKPKSKIQKYCSYNCNPHGAPKNHGNWRAIKSCKVCDKTYQPKTPQQKYCKKECQLIAWEKKILEKRKVTHFQIFERDGFRCQYCGKTPQDKMKLVVDHIYPLSKGGDNSPGNLITCCQKCNSSKSDKILQLNLLVYFWGIAAKKEIDFKEARDYWEKAGEVRRIKGGW